MGGRGGDGSGGEDGDGCGAGENGGGGRGRGGGGAGGESGGVVRASGGAGGGGGEGEPRLPPSCRSSKLRPAASDSTLRAAARIASAASSGVAPASMAATGEAMHAASTPALCSRRNASMPSLGLHSMATRASASAASRPGWRWRARGPGGEPPSPTSRAAPVTSAKPATASPPAPDGSESVCGKRRAAATRASSFPLASPPVQCTPRQPLLAASAQSGAASAGDASGARESTRPPACSTSAALEKPRRAASTACACVKPSLVWSAGQRRSSRKRGPLFSSQSAVTTAATPFSSSSSV